MNLTFKKTMLAMALTATAGFAQAQAPITTEQTIIDFSQTMGVLDAGGTMGGVGNAFLVGAGIAGTGDGLRFGKEAVDNLTDAELNKITKRSFGSVSLRDTVPSQINPLTDTQLVNDTTSGRWITVRPGSRVQPDNYLWVYLDGLAGVSNNSVMEPDNFTGVAPFAIKADNALRLVDREGIERARFAKAKVDANGNFVAIQFQFTSKWPAFDSDPITTATGLSIAKSAANAPVVPPATVLSPEYVVDNAALRTASSLVTAANPNQCTAKLRTGYATQSNTSTLPALSSVNVEDAACVRVQFGFAVTTGVDRIDVNQDRKYFVDRIDDADYTKGDFARANRQVAREGRLQLTTNNPVDYGFTPSLTQYQYVITSPQAAQSALLPDNAVPVALKAAAAYDATLYNGALPNPTSPYYTATGDTGLLHNFCSSFACTQDGATHRPATRDLATLQAAPEYVRLAVAGEVVHQNGIKDPNQWVIFDRDYTIALDMVTSVEAGLAWTARTIPATLANNKIISWEGNGSNVYIPYMPYRAENMGQIINLKNWSDTQVGKVKAHIVTQDGVTLPEVTVGTLNANSILMASGPIRAAVDAYRSANNIAATDVTRVAITLYSGASLDKVEVFTAYNNGASTAVVTNSSNKSDDKAAVKQSTHFNCTDTADQGGNTACRDENVEETPIP